MKIKIKDAKPFLKVGNKFIINKDECFIKNNQVDQCLCEYCNLDFLPKNLKHNDFFTTFVMIKSSGAEIDLLTPIHGRICDLFPYLKAGMNIKIFSNFGTIKKIDSSQAYIIYNNDIQKKLIPFFYNEKHEMEIIEELQEATTEENSITAKDPVDRFLKTNSDDKMLRYDINQSILTCPHCNKPIKFNVFGE